MENVVYSVREAHPSPCFRKGKRYWKHLLPAPITAMCQIDYRPRGFQAVAVALANNEIHLYKDKFLVDVIPIEENVYAMKFGKLGREDATLVMITKSECCVSSSIVLIR